MNPIQKDERISTPKVERCDTEISEKAQPLVLLYKRLYLSVSIFT